MVEVVCDTVISLNLKHESLAKPTNSAMSASTSKSSSFESQNLQKLLGRRVLSVEQPQIHEINGSNEEAWGGEAKDCAMADEFLNSMRER